LSESEIWIENDHWLVIEKAIAMLGGQLVTAIEK
jgi:hypothetical protein